MTEFPPTRVSVLVDAIDRLANTRMSTACPPPACATFETMTGVCPAHPPPVNEWDVELYVPLQSVVAIAGAV